MYRGRDLEGGAVYDDVYITRYGRAGSFSHNSSVTAEETYPHAALNSDGVIICEVAAFHAVTLDEIYTADDIAVCVVLYSLAEGHVMTVAYDDGSRRTLESDLFYNEVRVEIESSLVRDYTCVVVAAYKTW